MEKWQNSTAVVTGASAGIGQAITCALVKSGIHVIGLARRVERIEALAKKLEYNPGKIYVHKCDITDSNSVADAFKWIEKRFGIINILINNAGILKNVKIFDLNTDSQVQINEIIATNFTGLVQCTREAFRLMKKSENYCYIINMGSIYGKSVPFLPAVDQSHNVYNPTKSAVISFTEVIRQELIKQKLFKIRVSTINPGLVKTELYEKSGRSDDEMAEINKWPSLDADAIANGVLYILSTPYSVNVTDLTIKPVGEQI